MRKLIFLTVFALCGISCSKKNNNSATPASTATKPNSITVTVNNKVYKVEGASPLYPAKPEDWPTVNVKIWKYAAGSNLTFDVTGNNIDFKLGMETKIGSSDGTGTFDIEDNYYFEEKFTGGQRYDVKGGTVAVKTNTTNLTEGTMTINLSNAAGSKTVTGSFRITDKN